MTTATPTPITSGQGGCPPGATQTVCCLSREGKHEVTGNFKRMFQKYGRSKSWFQSKSAPTANLPSGVKWETYYYKDKYKFQLSYSTSAGTGGTSAFTGQIKVKLRARATVHSTPKTLLKSAPALFTTVTSQRITAAFTDWNKAIQAHWTNRKYTVELGAPDCPGTFTMSFSVVEVEKKPHLKFTVLDMKDPANDPTWAPILKAKKHKKHITAKALEDEARSDAGKLNLGDSRGTLVFAHEYGHWMGWGDEYIEVSDTMPHPNLANTTVDFEKRGSKKVSLRVAIRIRNPTRVYYTANGTDQEDIDITVPAASYWLMASFDSPQQYPARYVYTIVDDFIRLYNKDNYGGSKTAYCNNVL